MSNDADFILTHLEEGEGFDFHFQDYFPSRHSSYDICSRDDNADGHALGWCKHRLDTDALVTHLRA